MLENCIELQANEPGGVLYEHGICHDWQHAPWRRATADEGKRLLTEDTLSHAWAEYLRHRAAT